MALRPKDPQPDSDKHAVQKAAQQDVFLREVDDALRQDEMLGLLKRYGVPVLGVIVAGLLGLAGYLWWDHSQKQSADERGEQLIMALDQVQAGRLDTGDRELAALAEGGNSGSATAARLMRAGIALQQGRREDAVKLYREIAEDTKAPQPYRDLATIREVAASFDSMKPEQVIERLKPLATPGNPWFGPAGELVGIAYLKQGKENLAGPLFAQIARDKDTSESLRGRARQLAGLLGVDAIDDVAKAAGTAPEAASPAQP